ncbi:MAG: AAA family ATPase, partial [Alphaproteobacteria bacterium]
MLAGSLAQPNVCETAAITRLTLADFRSYAWARLDLESAPVVLTGPNGAGKTNLLEAISFLAPGRGLRRAALLEVDRRGRADERRAPWAVAARLESPSGAFELGTGRASDGGEDGERRVVRVDGMAARGQVAFARLVAITWVTPEMDRLFTGGRAGRRRFLDRMVGG